MSLVTHSLTMHFLIVMSSFRVSLLLLLFLSGSSSSSSSSSKLIVPELDSSLLPEFLSDHEHAVVLFVRPGGRGADPRSDRALSRLQQDTATPGGRGDDGGDRVPFVRVPADPALAAEFGAPPEGIPSAVLFRSGVPDVFPGDVLDPLELRAWVAREVRGGGGGGGGGGGDAEEATVDAAVLRAVAKRAPALLAAFVDDDSDLPVAALDEMRSVCDHLDVSLAVVAGRSEAAVFGISADRLPAAAYFERGVPSVYAGDPGDDPGALAEWVEDQRTSDTVEVVTEEILAYLSQSEEYLAVFFSGPCDERARTDQECRRVLADLEKIDDELDSYGVTLVTTGEVKYAGAHLGVRTFPSLGVFRNGRFLAYNGSLRDGRDMLTWMLDRDTLELKGHVEKVGNTMLGRLVRDEPHVVVLFCREEEEEDRETSEAVDRLSHVVVHRAEKAGIPMVRSTDDAFAADEFGLMRGGGGGAEGGGGRAGAGRRAWPPPPPLLVTFAHGVPVAFDGNMLDAQEVFAWISEVVDRSEMPMVETTVGGAGRGGGGAGRRQDRTGKKTFLLLQLLPVAISN